MKAEREIRRELESQGFTVVSQVGSGSYASVYKVMWKRFPNKLFAAKVFHMHDSNDYALYNSYMNEVDALRKITHSNIIKLHGYFKTENNLYLIMNFCSGGDLHTYVRKNGPLEGDTFNMIAKQVIEAVKECHNKKYVHRDIKPSNLLIDDEGKVILADFGLARYHEDGKPLHRIEGSIILLPLEVLTHQYFDPKKAEIWSLGITLYYLATGVYPWDAETPEDMVDQMLRHGLAFPKEISKDIQKLIESILINDPEQRPTIESIFEQIESQEITFESKDFLTSVGHRRINSYGNGGHPNDDLIKMKQISNI